MNLRDLKYLVTVVDHKHFGKAAEICCVSQPTLSMQIKKLEEFLGVVLIERTNKTVVITPLGLKIAEQARKILSLSNHIQEMAKLAADPLSGELRLGIIPTLGPYLLPRIVPLIMEHFPKLELTLIEGQTHVITDELVQGKLDLLLLALPIEHEEIETLKLFDEEFLLAVPQKHPYHKKTEVSYADLQGQEILLLEEGHCLRDQALDVCHMAGIKERADFRATSLETLRQMVVAGRGITLIPKLAVTEGIKGIAYIPFTKPAPSRSVGLAWRKTSTRHPLFHAMAEKLRGVAG